MNKKESQYEKDMDIKHLRARNMLIAIEEYERTINTEFTKIRKE
jgi:hypothetical protein